MMAAKPDFTTLNLDMYRFSDVEFLRSSMIDQHSQIIMWDFSKKKYVEVVLEVFWWTLLFFNRIFFFIGYGS